MALKDLFRPGWQHSNPQVRVQAVAKLTDDRILTELAAKDPSLEVRLAAVAKIQSSECLAEYLKTVKERAGDRTANATLNAALARLTEPKLLADVAKNCSDEYIGNYAVDKIKTVDEALLVDIVRNGRNLHVGTHALGWIKSEENLLGIATSDVCNTKKWRDDFARSGRVAYCHALAAIRRLGPEALARAATNPKTDRAMRSAAVERLEDKVVVTKIAETDADAYVRYSAVKKLSDQVVLARIGETDAYKGVRLSAVERLSDQQALTRIAKKDRELEVQLAAASKVTDPQCVRELEEVLHGSEAALKKLLALGVFPASWCEGDNGRRLLSIVESPNQNGLGCQFYELGACLFRVRARRDMSFGPEACSVPSGGYRQCFVLARARV